jgi:energy-coupling factor transporter ATP-binding protein EcfA2
MKSPWPQEIVPIQGTRITVGRSSKHDVTVKHVAVSGTHFALQFQDGQLAVEDLDSRYGTFVNGARVKNSLLQPGDVLKFANSPSYLFKNGRLMLQEEGAGMEVRLENVGLERGGKKLLEGLNLTIHPGTFVGVLGPSGAGKSLTVALLNSTWDPTWGAVYFDGDKPVIGNKEEYRSRQGTVMQEDLVYPALTAEENLVLAGRLRMASLTEAELERRVNETLEEVNMTAHRDKPVRVLSGGQKKRVSIAIELLMRPQFIILDEPTSGLDPGTASDLMDVLRGLARKGFTIVCITHTLDTMNFFDTLLVLGLKHPQGAPNKFATLAYYGDPDKLYPAYGVRNAADLFKKLENLDTANVSQPATDSQTSIVEAPSDTDSSGVRLIMGEILGRFKAADAAGFFNQFKVVLKRSWLTFFRDRSSLMLNLIQPIILATLTVLAQYAAPASISIHFFLVVSALWMGMTLTVREIVNEKKLYARDRLVALDPLAFLAGKLVTALLLLAPVAVLLYLSARIAIPIFLQEGPTMDALRSASFFNSTFVLWLAGAGGALVGLAISTLSKTERMAVMILPIALLLQVLLSRVVFGHSAQWDSQPLPFPGVPIQADALPEGKVPAKHSPFNPVKTLDEYLASEDASWQGNLVMAGSFLMVTRPATALLDMPPSGRAPPGAVGVEWIYLLCLMAFYLAITAVMFLLVESKWIGELR